jgi:succinate dehydrogenase / fumarate reductase, flavoprotein subunit
MSQTIPQDILDRLTRVNMPTGISSKSHDEVIEIAGLKIPLHRVPALILGSGAAGLRAAVELKREGVDVVVASTGLFSGTSACSGSDKQTLHTAGTSNRGDHFVKLSQDISAGGCMDKDTAYIEAVGSIQAFSGLQYIGLPLPQDRFGSVLRYQTDHDDVGRATSCGPRTSRLMVKVLCEEALRLGVKFLKDTTGVKILKSKDEQGQERCVGVLAVERNTSYNELGLVLIFCDRLVLATGGPGELYRDSVYPRFCFGSLGMALDAGIEVTNLTECQFGIGTRRTEFPWNLSGTYVQVMPYIYSIDQQGQEINFLADYYRTTQEMVSNVFRKGYQWPFHASRMLDYKSSLLDLAIFIESQKGHSIYMDFNRNPQAVPGDVEFSLERLDEDVRAYLENNKALQELPIQRLLQMNPLAIELYKMHGKDISQEPLAFNVSHQHMNGGVEVNIWAESSLKACYAIGEVSGTHGVTRPGGAALNAGQVFGIRCAKHIAQQRPCLPKDAYLDILNNVVAPVIEQLQVDLSKEQGLKMSAIRDEVQARMSDHAGFICKKENIAPALKSAQQLNSAIQTKGIKAESNQIAQYFQWQQTALCSEATLLALQYYADNGGGSRGARALCSSEGTAIPKARNVDLSAYKFIEEKPEQRQRKIVIQKLDKLWNVSERALRNMEDPGQIYFERNWSHYLTGNIYSDGFVHP